MRYFALGVMLLMCCTNTLSAANTYRPKTPQTYITGVKWGCYYWNKNSNKTYVDRILCKKR